MTMSSGTSGMVQFSLNLFNLMHVSVLNPRRLNHLYEVFPTKLLWQSEFTWSQNQNINLSTYSSTPLNCACLIHTMENPNKLQYTKADMRDIKNVLYEPTTENTNLSPLVFHSIQRTLALLLSPSPYTFPHLSCSIKLPKLVLLLVLSD